MDTEDLTQERIGINQSRFREANERIELAADKMGLVGPVPFICECAQEECVEIVRLSIEGYEEGRHDPRLFFTVPGHQRGAAGTRAPARPRRGRGEIALQE